MQSNRKSVRFAMSTCKMLNYVVVVVVFNALIFSADEHLCVALFSPVSADCAIVSISGRSGVNKAYVLK